jgi:hypothetical protein
MKALVIGLALWTSCLPTPNGLARNESDQSPQPAAAVRRLVAEFESAQKTALETARTATTAEERKQADRAMRDRRKYAQRFLKLSAETNDEATAVDALAWAVRIGARIPEGDEAVKRIADRYVRSDRLAAMCHSLAARGPAGEALLQRIFDENPSPGIRGRTCLALALARSLRLRQETRSQGSLPPIRPEQTDAREAFLSQTKSRSSALAVEIEYWLKRALDDFSGVLVEQDITDNLGLLAENLGPTAGQILRRIAETHPQPDVRWDAECALAIQQMQIASLVAELRFVAAEPPGSKKCAGPALAAACVFGGETRLNAIDPKPLVGEIEQRLQRIAVRVNDVKEPGISYFHLITDCPTLSQYHAGTEALLRFVAKGDPNPRCRAAARRSLAIYLAGLAELSRMIDSERSRWVDRLGEDRVQQIGHLNPDRLLDEARALAEAISTENQQAGKLPDAKIEKLRTAKF